MAVIDRVDQTQLKAVGRAGLWAIIGLVGGQAIALLLAQTLLSFTGSVGYTVLSGITTTSFGVGLVIVAVAYLRLSDLSWSYIDIRLPSLRELGYSLLGVVILLVGIFIISLVFQILGIETAQSTIEQQARQMEHPEFLLAFVPLSWLVIGPGEELVYRNVVQKSLYDSFDRRHAVVIASVLFAIVHIPQYSTGGAFSTVNTLAIILVLASVLGESYRITENLTVPILIHGTYNAIQFLLLYALLTSDVSTGTLVLL